MRERRWVERCYCIPPGMQMAAALAYWMRLLPLPVAWQAWPLLLRQDLLLHGHDHGSSRHHLWAGLWGGLECCCKLHAPRAPHLYCLPDVFLHAKMSPQVCGVVVNVRPKQFRISLWTKTASNEAVQVRFRGSTWPAA